MAITYSSVPASLYDVHPNDFPNQGHQVSINRSFDVGSGKSFPAHTLFPYPLPFQQPNEVSYFQPPPQVELAPTFPTNGVAYNGGMAHNFQPYNAVPYLQTQPSFISASSTISDSSSSLQGALTPASAPSVRKQLQKANSKSKSDGKRVTRNATQYAVREVLTGQPKRKRGPNKRPPGTSFSDLLDGLTHEVRQALEEEYKGCCESVNTKDISTKQKHWFTNRHCINLPKEYQDAIPNFVCPAFLAFNPECRSKVGRYDSTERHCQNCAGFQKIKSGQEDVAPVIITRSEYKDVQLLRMALAENEGETEATKKAVDSVRRMLAGLFKDGLPVINLEGESNGSGAIVDHTAQPPTTSVPLPVANDVHQPSSSEPESVDECDFDTSPVTNHEGESNISREIVDHTAQPATTSVPVPMVNPVSLFEPGSVDEWSFDTPSPVINHEGESNLSGEIVGHTAHPPTTSVPVPMENPTQSYVEKPPLFEPERIDTKQSFDALFSDFM